MWKMKVHTGSLAAESLLFLKKNISLYISMSCRVCSYVVNNFSDCVCITNCRVNPFEDVSRD